MLLPLFQVFIPCSRLGGREAHIVRVRRRIEARNLGVVSRSATWEGRTETVAGVKGRVQLCIFVPFDWEFSLSVVSSPRCLLLRTHI